MINKFQQGGKLDAIMLFVLGLALTLQADPLQVIQIAQLNPEALQNAVQVYQLTLDMGQAAQAFQLTLQLKTKAMKHGAKLQYLKSLKNKCADDEELYYYKKGGSVGCGCKKKEDGGEVTKTENSIVTKFKNKISKGKKGVVVNGSTKLPTIDGMKKANEKAKEKLNKPFQPRHVLSSVMKCGGKAKSIKKDCGGSAVVKAFKAARCGAKMSNKK